MKYFLIVIHVTCMVVLSNPVMADEGGPLKKLKRGAVNIVTAPVEVVKYTREYWIEGSKKTDHILVWLFSGSVEGMVEMVKRLGSGVYDVVTFPFSAPGEFDSLQKPDYVFEDWPTRD